MKMKIDMDRLASISQLLTVNRIVTLIILLLLIVAVVIN